MNHLAKVPSAIAPRLGWMLAAFETPLNLLLHGERCDEKRCVRGVSSHTVV